jgi:hypothetical protein
MSDNIGVVGAPSAADPQQTAAAQASIQPSQVLISSTPGEQFASTLSTMQAKAQLSDTVAPFAVQQTTAPAVEYVPMTQPLPIELKLPPTPVQQPVAPATVPPISSPVPTTAPEPVPAVSPPVMESPELPPPPQPQQAIPTPVAPKTTAPSIPASNQPSLPASEPVAPPAQPVILDVQANAQKNPNSKIYSSNTRAVWNARRSMKILYIVVVLGAVILGISLVMYWLSVGSPLNLRNLPFVGR